MLRLRQVAAIARITIQDNLRKQVLHVALILTLAAIGSTTLLSFFDLGVQIKILKDLSLAAILFCGGMLAIVISVGGIPSEVQQMTAYPVLARALRRSDFLLGKFVGTVSTCLLCMGIIGSVFLVILGIYERQFDTAVAVGMGYAALEVALLAAVATFFSVFLSPMVAATVTFFVFAIGQIKVVYLLPLVDRATGAASKLLLGALYSVLPNLDSFNFKDALVHNLPVPLAYMWLVAVYGLVYIACVVGVSGVIFSRKQL